jgi:hypothetical protein
MSKKLNNFMDGTLANGRKTFVRVFLVLGIILGGFYLSAATGMNGSQNVSYTSTGYTLFGADTGVFNYNTSLFGNCYTAGCSTNDPFVAVDRHTGGYTFMSPSGNLYQFGSVFPGEISSFPPLPGGHSWASIAFNYADNGLYAMDNYGDVYTMGGAAYYGQAGDCACYKQLIIFPQGGYGTLAFNGVVHGYGPGSISTGGLGSIGNIVSGDYNPYTNQVYVLGSDGHVYTEGSGGSYLVAAPGISGTAVSITVDNFGRYDFVTNSGYVYALSSNPGAGAIYNGGWNGASANAPFVAMSNFYTTPTLSGASISNSDALSPGTITVTGNGFINGDSTIYVNGSPISTNYVNGNTLTGTIGSYGSATNLSLFVASSYGNTGSTNISLTCPSPSLGWSGPTSQDISTSVTLTETISNACTPTQNVFDIGTNQDTSASLVSNPSLGVYVYSVTYGATSTSNVGAQNVSVNIGSGSATAANKFNYSFTVTDTPSSPSSLLSGGSVTFNGSNLNGSDTLSESITGGSNPYTSGATTGSATAVTFSNVPSALSIYGPSSIGSLSFPFSINYNTAVTINGVTSSHLASETYSSLFPNNAPVINSLSIANGGGQTGFSVTGAYLAGATTVTFTNGTNQVTEPVTLSSTTSGTITLPTATALGITSPNTQVALSLSSDGYNGISSGSANYLNAYPNQPTISIPSSIANGGGQIVSVSGTNLAGATAVTFTNGTNQVTEPVTLSSTTSGTITLPTATALGITSPNTQVALSLSSDGYNVSAGSTTYQAVYLQPTISLVSPTTLGYDGGVVTVSGSDFAGVTSLIISGKTQVTIQSSSVAPSLATFDVNSSDLMAASGGASRALSLSLATDSYSAVAAGSLSFVLPDISSVSPSVLQFTGGQITISGNYLPINSAVTFTNGASQVSVSATAINGDQIVVNAPSPDKLGVNYPGSVSVTVAPSSALGFASSPYTISYATTLRTKTGVLNLAIQPGTLDVTSAPGNDIVGQVDTVTSGYLPPTNWQDTTGLGNGWNGQVQVSSFVYTGNWIALNGSTPLVSNASSQYTGSQNGITYVVTVTGATTATYQSNTSNDGSGSFTFTPGVASALGANGLSITIPTGVSSGVYEIHVGTQSPNTLSLDNLNPPAFIGSSVGGSNPPVFQNPTATLTYGASPVLSQYGAAVKFISASQYEGMGRFPVQPFASVAIDANSWAATYTANVQYSIVTGP